ncbi:Nucleoid-associated protein YejK [Sinobacterium norvegicum]|uniref:Nucleoid-associated protein YejK n=1 Tax=Sinobacterium norvegicum TaxID=1641715 RepID=A0ABM9AHA3_9GAMM|nr:nucleoid-associated protein [Sinobacterium norvegicum]CAH0992594.1 Nucleoid-associated protein YejK [Sinobacterium norvegicum]
MTLNACIIQHISSEADSHDNHDQCLPVNDQTETLFSQLKHNFITRVGKKYGCFDTEGEAQFAASVSDLCADSDLATLSGRLAEQVFNGLKEAQQSLSAYFVFGREKVAEEEFLYLFCIQLTEALQISEQLEINDTQFLNLSEIGFALRLNISQWQANEDKFLTMYSYRLEKELVKALQDIIGFTSTVNANADTKALINSIQNYAHQLPEEKAHDVRSQAFEYCESQHKAGEPIALDELSRQINQDEPQQFQQFVAEKVEEKPKPEVIADAKQLKALVKMAGRDKEFTLSFNSNTLGERIIWDEDNDTLTIHGLPNALKAQMKRQTG